MNQDEQFRQLFNAKWLDPVQYSWSGPNPPPTMPNPANILAANPDTAPDAPSVATNTGVGEGAQITYRIKATDGKIYKVNAPAGTSAEQAAWILKNHLNLPEPEQPVDISKDLLEGTAAVGTGVARGLMSVAGMPSDLAGFTGKMIPSVKPVTDVIQNILPGTTQIRKGISQLTGGASEYVPPEPGLQTVQAGFEAVPSYGKRIALALLSGAGGKLLENSQLTENPDLNRVLGNLAPAVIPPVMSVLHTATHITQIPKLLKDLENFLGTLKNNPMAVAANLAQPAISTEAQYQANRQLPALGPTTTGQIRAGY